MNPSRRHLFHTSAFLLFTFCLTAIGATPPKEALLIANGKYSHFAGLAHPEPDAEKLGAALEELGFRVRVVRDGNREEMLEAISEFERGLRNTGAIAFFHYGGHGVQVDGKNYLLPADSDIPDERRVATRAVALDEVMTAMDAAAARASIIVIDACRDNPLPAGSGRNLARGLSVVGMKPKNSMVIYAAEAGSKALDGLFTPILASSLQQKGRSINQIMMSVRSEVYAKSSGQQTPGEYNQLFEELFLGELPGDYLAPERVFAANPAPTYEPVKGDKNLILKTLLNSLKSDFLPILDQTIGSTSSSQTMQFPFNFKSGDTFSKAEKSLLDLSKTTGHQITGVDYQKNTKFLTVEKIPQKNLLSSVFIFEQNYLRAIELHYGNDIWSKENYIKFYNDVKSNVDRKYGEGIPIARGSKYIDNTIITYEGFQWGEKSIGLGVFLFDAKQNNQDHHIILLRYNSKKTFD
jgi:hypothetical protein